MEKIIELKVDDNTFSDMYVYQILAGLFKNGYTVAVTPTTYSNGENTLMIEIGDIDEGFARCTE